MYAFNSWSFNRGFLEYLNKAEIQKLTPMVNELTAGFEQTGDWGWLTNSLETWDSMLQRHVGKRPAPHPRPDFPADFPQNAPPSEAIDDRPPASGSSSVTSSILTFDAQLVLGDRDKQILIGPGRSRPDAASRVWIPIPSGDTIAGYLGYRQIRQFSGGIDDVFAAQQRRSFAYAALFMIALSGVLAGGCFGCANRASGAQDERRCQQKNSPASNRWKPSQVALKANVVALVVARAERVASEVPDGIPGFCRHLI